MALEIDLSGRVAFVTGGSRGLGRADALTLARAGADVVVADLLVESELSSDTDRPGALAAVARAADELGSVDILVNNAGTLDHVAQFHDQSPELWERDLRVNLSGAFNCAQAVWPHMKEHGWGRIVNMSSVAGTLGGFGQASYSTTKAGLLGLTRSLALEGARSGITCNAIVPGIIDTEAFRFGNPQMNERTVRRTAMRAAGEPQDVANAIAFLCSD